MTKKITIIRIKNSVQIKIKCKLLGAVYPFLLKSKLNSVVFTNNSKF